MRKHLMWVVCVAAALVASFGPGRKQAGIPVVFSFAGSGTSTIQTMASDSQGNLYVAGATTSADFPVLNAAQPQIGDSRIMRSRDGGATWTRLGNPPADIGVLVPDPVNPQVLFAANSAAIFKSSDAGQNWRTVYTSTTPAYYQPPSIAVDPARPSHLAALVIGVVLVSSDGGESWTAGWAAPPGCASVGADPAGSGAILLNCPNQTYLSHDGGFSFTHLAPSPANIAAFDPFHRNRIYAIATYDPPYGPDLYVSMDGGQTWTSRTAPAALSGAQQLIPDPDQPDTWYVLANQNWLVSHDGFNTVSPLNVPGGGGPAQLATLSRSCGPGGGLYFGAGFLEGIVASYDFGATWLQLPKSVVGIASGPSCSLYAFHDITSDAFVAKMAPGGSRTLWATFLGGSAQDAATAMSLDPAGNLWVTGTTNSRDFPSTAPRLGQPGLTNVFVTEYDSGGAMLLSVVLGGSVSDTPSALAADRSGNVFVTGNTISTNFPTTPGAYGSQFPAPDQSDKGFLSKIGPDGRLAFSTRIAPDISGGYTQFTGIAVDADGQAIVAGVNAGLGQAAGLLLRFDPSGSQLTYAQYFSGPDRGLYGPQTLATDESGYVYSLGVAPSTALPTPGAYVSPARSNTCGTSYSYCFIITTVIYPGDIVVTKMRASDLQPVFTAILGANCRSYPGSLAIGPDGAITFSVSTNSGFPLQHPYGGTTSANTGAVAQLSPDGSKLRFSTFVETSTAPAIAVPPGDVVYAAYSAGQHPEISALRVLAPRPPPPLR